MQNTNNNKKRFTLYTTQSVTDKLDALVAKYPVRFNSRNQLINVAVLHYIDWMKGEGE